MRKRARGTQQGKIKIAARQLLGGTQNKQLVQIGMRRQQPAERRLSRPARPERPAPSAAGHIGRTGAYPQALLGEQQQAASGQGFARPARQVGAAAHARACAVALHTQASRARNPLRPNSKRPGPIARRRSRAGEPALARNVPPLRRACPGSSSTLPRLLCASA